MKRAWRVLSCEEKVNLASDVYRYWATDKLMTLAEVAAQFRMSGFQLIEELCWIEGLSFETLEQYVKCPPGEREERYGWLMNIGLWGRNS